MKNKLGLLVIICLLVLFSAVQLEAADSKVVEVEGLGTISDNNLSVAKEKAVNDGLRRAVEQVVGTYVSSSTKTENARLIEDKILKSSQGYVKSYTILSKNPGKEMYKVNLRVEVGVKDLEDDLEALELNIKRHGNPRLMVLIEQKKDDHWLNLSPEIVENQMIGKFAESGYQVVDRRQIKKIIDKEQKRSIVQGNYDLAAKLGTKLRSDLVIIGDARLSEINLDDVYEGDVAGSLKSYQGQINAKVINTSTAQVIAAVNGEEKGAGANEEGAARKALLNTADKVAEKLVDKVSKGVIQEEKTIEFKIAGIDSVTQLNKIKGILPSITGVKGAYFREYNDGLAIFDVDIHSSTEVLTLAAELEEKVNFQFGVTNMSGFKLTLKVK